MQSERDCWKDRGVQSSTGLVDSGQRNVGRKADEIRGPAIGSRLEWMYRDVQAGSMVEGGGAGGSYVEHLPCMPPSKLTCRNIETNTRTHDRTRTIAIDMRSGRVLYALLAATARHPPNESQCADERASSDALSMCMWRSACGVSLAPLVTSRLPPLLTPACTADATPHAINRNRACDSFDALIDRL